MASAPLLGGDQPLLHNVDARVYPLEQECLPVADAQEVDDRRMQLHAHDGVSPWFYSGMLRLFRSWVHVYDFHRIFLTTDHMSQSGTNVLIDGLDGDTITIRNATLANLDAGDFLF